MKGRARRILPAYLLVNGIWFFILDIILYKEGLATFLMDIMSLNFWINGRLTTWYLSSLLVMQFLTPAYMKLWKKYPGMDRFAIPAVLLICVGITYVPAWDQVLEHLLVFFYRIPAYLLGLSIGRRICENRADVSISAPLAIFVLVGSICVLVISSGLTPLYLRWVLRYAMYFPIALALSCAVSHLPENKLFRYLGTHSLEIYLLHEKTLWVLAVLAKRIWGDGPLCSALVNILSIAAACVGAEILHSIITFAFFKRRRKVV